MELVGRTGTLQISFWKPNEIVYRALDKCCCLNPQVVFGLEEKL